MEYKDYYATLGVPVDADLPQIKKAYRKLARLHHPDVSKTPGAEERFKEAAEAYATLKDPDKRAAYDELGRRPMGEEFSAPPHWGNVHESVDDLELADLLAALSRKHGRFRREAMPVSGQDYEIEAKITLEEAHRGTSVNLKLHHVDGAKTLQVTIPAGVVNGQKLRLRGKGGKGRGGGADGDIYLHIELLPHLLFRSDGHDLHIELPLTPSEAALGAKVGLPTLEGEVMLTVPAGTQSGQKLRLREKGLKDRSGGRGHLYATVRIAVPTSLSDAEWNLFEQLGKVSDFNPRTPKTKENDHAPASI